MLSCLYVLWRGWSKSENNVLVEKKRVLDEKKYHVFWSCLVAESCWRNSSQLTWLLNFVWVSSIDTEERYIARKKKKQLMIAIINGNLENQKEKITLLKCIQELSLLNSLKILWLISWKDILAIINCILSKLLKMLLYLASLTR